jgi:hypothetical protein
LPCNICIYLACEHPSKQTRFIQSDAAISHKEKDFESSRLLTYHDHTVFLIEIAENGSLHHPAAMQQWQRSSRERENFSLSQAVFFTIFPVQKPRPFSFYRFHVSFISRRPKASEVWKNSQVILSPRISLSLLIGWMSWASLVSQGIKGGGMHVDSFGPYACRLATWYESPNMQEKRANGSRREWVVRIA